MKRLLLLSALMQSSIYATQVVADGESLRCQEYRLHQEVRLYKDPSLFLPQLSQIYADPVAGWDELMKENPLVMTIRGSVQLMKLGPEREFKNFGPISRIYELVDPRFRVQKPGLTNLPKTSKKNPDVNAMILPIKICSQDSYNDTMGFVLSSELKRAQMESEDKVSLPPSGHPNPIPKLRKAPSWD